MKQENNLFHKFLFNLIFYIKRLILIAIQKNSFKKTKGKKRNFFHKDLGMDLFRFKKILIQIFMQKYAKIIIN